MSQIRRFARSGRRIAKSASQLDSTHELVLNVNHFVLLIHELAAGIDGKLVDLATRQADLLAKVVDHEAQRVDQASNLEAMCTSQLEALAYLNRTLRQLSDRVGALERAAADR
jgi:hypothetical protein